jgi:hypothetical protein
MAHMVEKKEKKFFKNKITTGSYLRVLTEVDIRFGLTVVSFVTSTSRKLLLMELVALRETPRMGVCSGVKGRVGGWLEFAMIRGVRSFMIDAAD